MIRAKHLIGFPLLSVTTGERLASVRSLVIDLVSRQLRGLVVQKATLFREPQVLRFDQLHAIGQDMVLVKEGQKAMPLADLLAALPQARTEERLFGRQVVTSAGKVIGALEDVLFDPRNGVITYYLLTDGLLQSLLEGPAAMSAPAQVVVGEEHLIIEVETPPTGDQLTMGRQPDWY